MTDRRRPRVQPGLSEELLYRLACGVVVTQLRDKAQLSQGVVAQRAGITQPTLSRLERGVSVPDLWTWHQLALVFGMNEASATILLLDVLRGAEAAARRALRVRKAWWEAASSELGIDGVRGMLGVAAREAVGKLLPVQP